MSHSTIKKKILIVFWTRINNQPKFCFLFPAATSTSTTILPNGSNEFFPTLPSPSNGLPPPSVPTSPTQTVTQPTSTPSIIPPPASVYLPTFPFAAHPELLHKSPFMPYGMRPIPPPHPLSGLPSALTELQQISNNTININNNSSARLSPASSRNSSSSPPSNSQLTPNNKINSSVELNSTNEHSSHSSSEESDDEHIDVVKSAFVPILRPTLSATSTTTTTPDSTVKEHSPSREIPVKIKCELKAPSSKKLLIHDKPIGLSPRSPDTRITQEKKGGVWRPYWKIVETTPRYYKYWSVKGWAKKKALSAMF